MRKKDDSIERNEVLKNKQHVNQMNANGITDEIIIIIENEHNARKGLEQNI